MAAFGDSNLYLRRVSQDGLLELKIEHRAAAPPQPLQLQLIVDQTGTQQTARFVVNEGEKKHNDPTATRILELLTASEQPLSSAVLREKLGVRNQTVAQALQYLVADGLILRAGRDGWRSIQTRLTIRSRSRPILWERERLSVH